VSVPWQRKEVIGDATLYLGDCLDVVPALIGIDSVVTDSPYGLQFMGKDWDRGVPGERFWRVIMDACKPGAHLLAFGGTRTYHQLVCAIEDAGWEIRDTIMWVYGSGFPKSLDVSKAIDKAVGAEREIVGIDPNRATRLVHQRGEYETTCGWDAGNRRIDITAPATEAAKQWDGWGTALKPAVELICLARKPLSEKTIAANVLKHGVGGLNIDRCRIPINPDVDASQLRTMNRKQRQDRSEWGFSKESDTPQVIQPSKGRWPANLIHDGSEEVMGLFPQSSTTGKRVKSDRVQQDVVNTPFTRGKEAPEYIDSGSAARFFYCAKASRAERGKGNDHPTVKPIALMRYLCRLITPPNGIVLDPFMGSGSTLIAAPLEGFQSVGIEIEEHSFDIACKRIAQAERQGQLFEAQRQASTQEELLP